MTFIHAHFTTAYSEEEFQAALKESWEKAALYYYTRFYNFDEKSPEEWRLVRAWEAQLSGSCPEAYKTGVHLVGDGAAFMGEDVYMIDGALQHTLHGDCARCGSYKLLSRNGRVWCAGCEQETSFRGW